MCKDVNRIFVNKTNDARRPLHVDPEQLGDGYSRFVIVRLSRDLPVAKSEDLRSVVDELKLNALGELLDLLGKPPMRRLITSVAPENLLAMEKEVSQSPWRPLNSLTQYWRIDLRSRHEPISELAKRFAGLHGVETAYAEQVVSDPVVNAADDPLNAQQNYLDAAPTGIDARWAWTQGCEGQGVGVVDLEQGWRLGHEDYAAKKPTLIFNSNRDGVDGYVGDHGTAVMGIIAADDNTLGVVGVAPSISSLRATSHFDGATAFHVADAIVAAVPTMPVGHVLLLEVQRGATLLPTETDLGDFDAIRLATARGIIVVEAAGNADIDLDAFTDAAGRFRLNRRHADFRDSGAIMVGAAESPVVDGNAHDRWALSNFGSRIDCYGWGESVTTSGGDGELSPDGDIDASYTGEFSGTSSASPIVVGAAVLTQSMYCLATGTMLSPGQMRAILSNPANGTPQSATVPGAIGVMPNLRQIGQVALGLVPDVYLRDAVGDKGKVPSAGALSSSPDVIVRSVQVANLDMAFGDGSGTENDETLGFEVESGHDNYIYVRMRNRGATAANGVRATVYWSPVATLVTPNLWTLIGTTGPGDVPTGNVLTMAPELVWPSAGIPATGHYCFVAYLDHAQDPAPPVPGPTDWNGFLDLIRNQNNVAWRNFNVIDVQPDPEADPIAMPFLLTGDPGSERRFDIEIAVHLPTDAKLLLELDQPAVGILPTVWQERIHGTRKDIAILEIPRLRSNALCGVRMKAAAAHRCRFILKPTKGLAAGLHTIAVRQYEQGIQVGGVTWALRPKHKKNH